MGYSVKWITDNLGISRDALRYYEKEKLISKFENRNPTNNYREYSDEEVEKIWNIKLLIGIGFTAKEIRAFMNDDDFDFDMAITKKVEELEKKHDENVLYLNFAKSIKLTGQIPTTSEVGSIKFDDFIEYARKNWNFYDNPRVAPFMKVVDALITKESQEWSPDDFKYIVEWFENSSFESMMYTSTIHGYYQIISDMRELGHTNDVVQRVVRLLHEYQIKHNFEPELETKITPQSLAKNTVPYFLNGDIAVLNEKSYGKEGCQFIARAVAYYGGYDIDDW